ncbi:uncharacterized protein LOC123547072 [Mercenaria mercenaria]|uniref:uncharacterized protein LOC123547072 n=1 Tax=Mercenaria mercenaria TaxID=6596 RepID=UPI00234E880E|nr:uncharacterized protein LOC123547072 [Mercenaria mercenaria]
MSEVQTQETGSLESTEELFESNLLYELLLSQKEAARFLELAYLALREDPDIARQVRNTANDAQNQHLRTHGLVREYQGTAVHVVKTMLPLIETGIKKRKTILVQKGLDKVLTYVDDMVKKTKETVNEYYKIKTAVNDEISNIDEKNRNIKLRGSDIKAEMKDKALNLEKGKRDLTDLQSKMKSKEEEIKKLKVKREDYIADSVQKYGIGDSFKELFTTGMATLGSWLGGAQASKEIYEGARAATTARKEQASKQALNASEKTKQDIEEEQKKIEENERRIAKIKEEAVESLVVMEKLALESADQMNEECLKLAGKELGKVASLFAKILLFWEDFAAKLSALSKSHDGVKLFIEFIHDPELAEDIDESVTHVKKVWNSFGYMCTCYVVKSESQLPELYAFMSNPVDEMDFTECNRRKQEVLAHHRADIKQLEEKVM